MSSNKTITYLFLIGVLFTCNILAQRVNIPLKKGLKDSIFFTVKYGSGQCEINMTPNIDYCSNVISQKVLIPDQCGSEYIGENDFAEGSDYKASFQLGDTQANLLFTVPNSKSYFQYSQSLCFGYKLYESERNTLLELLEDKKISQPIAYFSLNESSTTSSFGSVVGSLTIGEPQQSLVDQGVQFYYLKSSSGDSTFTAVTKSYIKIFNRSISSESFAFIDVNSPFTVLDSFGYKDLLDTFTQRYIPYRLSGDGVNQLVYLDSIEYLDSLGITFERENSLPYRVNLKPSQYTKQQPDGTYLLLIKRIFYTASITIGNTILESHIIGFDLARQQILIAEKEPEQTNNFRGTRSI